jgi:hypothetical protein
VDAGAYCGLTSASSPGRRPGRQNANQAVRTPLGERPRKPRQSGLPATAPAHRLDPFLVLDQKAAGQGPPPACIAPVLVWCPQPQPWGSAMRDAPRPAVLGGASVAGHPGRFLSHQPARCGAGQPVSERGLALVVLGVPLLSMVRGIPRRGSATRPSACGHPRGCALARSRILRAHPGRPYRGPRRVRARH